MDVPLENKLLHLVRRRFVEALTLLYFVPLIWGGLVPFDFTSHPAPEGPLHWLGLPAVGVFLPDAVANVAVYIPIGILLRLVLVRRGWGATLSLIVTCLLGGSFSYLTEWSQLFSQTRISSAPDFICNCVGTVSGAFLGAVLHLCHAAFRELIRDRVRRFEYAVVERSSGVLASVCAAVIFLAATAPFDVTFSVNRLVQSVKSTKLTPFAADARLSAFFQERARGAADLADDIAARDRTQLILDYVWIVLAFSLLSAAVYRYLTAHCRASRFGAVFWTLVACVMLTVVCFCAQLFVMSRRADVSDIVLALIGAVAGVGFSQWLVCEWRMAHGREGATRYPHRGTIVTVLLVGWGLFLTARELAPYLPDFSGASIARQLSLAELLPFRTYERSKLPIAMDDLLGKLLGFAALGALAAFRRVLLGADAVKLKAFKFSLQVVLAVAVLEAAQIFLPSRTPALTDALIAGLGVLVGVMGMRLAAVYFQSLQLGRAVLTDRMVFNVEFGGELPAPVERVDHAEALAGGESTPTSADSPKESPAS